MCKLIQWFLFVQRLLRIERDIKTLDLTQLGEDFFEGFSEVLNDGWIVAHQIYHNLYFFEASDSYPTTIAIVDSRIPEVLEYIPTSKVVENYLDVDARLLLLENRIHEGEMISTLDVHGLI